MALTLTRFVILRLFSVRLCQGQCLKELGTPHNTETILTVLCHEVEGRGFSLLLEPKKKITEFFSLKLCGQGNVL
jgi:hypothetical protein